jgi:hypothetical protein
MLLLRTKLQFGYHDPEAPGAVPISRTGQARRPAARWPTPAVVTNHQEAAMTRERGEIRRGVILQGGVFPAAFAADRTERPAIQRGAYLHGAPQP